MIPEIEEKAKIDREINPITNEKIPDNFWESLSIESLKRKTRGKARYSNTPQYNSMLNLIENSTILTPEENKIVSATYIGVIGGEHCFTVDGFKDDVRIDNRISETKYLKNTVIGDKIDILIKNIDEDNYHIEGTISGIYESKAHESLKALEEDLVVMADVKSLNPAGYDLDIIHDGITLPGFMPNTLAGINKLYDPSSIVGKSLEVMIESYSEKEGTYIVSRKKYLKTLIPTEIENLDISSVYNGYVTGTTQFGVFVEFNECLTGMIHKANILPEWQDRISEIKPGFSIEFYIKEIVKDKGSFKIILTQIIRETLWDNIKIGQTLNGTIKDNKGFGTLVSLDQETMGLIHSSEMEKIGKKFDINQPVKVKVLALDRSNRKIFLTIA